jgi:hypothetical protein
MIIDPSGWRTPRIRAVGAKPEKVLSTRKREKESEDGFVA